LDYLCQRHTIYLLTFAAPEDGPGLDELRLRLAGVTAVPYPPNLSKPSLPMQQAMQATIRHFQPDTLHVNGLDLWPYAPPDTRRVLDLHDIPSRLHSRLLTIQRGIPWLSDWRSRRAASGWRRREAEAVVRATAVIVTSEPDRAAILDGIDEKVPPVVVIPNGVTLADWPPATNPPKPATILFPGALNWPPNIDATQGLAQDVLPLVQQRFPDVRVVIAGRLPDRAVWRLAEGNTAVTLIANPPDMHPIFAQAAAVVVPLRAASGTRLKILQALSVGRPVVSTPVGAEGLELVNGRHLAIAELVTPFADALSELLTNPARQQALIKSGKSIVSQFDWNHHLPALDGVYDT
jgi:glycosyltransferase involved in cell wall biosynthesis